jgi:molecular chaperone DnaK (HSP70)
MKDKVSFVFKDAKISQYDINKVILIGGVIRMSGIRSLLIDLFEENKIKSDINPDEAIGTSLETTKIQKEKKMKFVLQDIIPFDTEVLVQNPNIDDKVHREIIHPSISKYSKISSNNNENCFLLLDNIFNKEERIIITINEYIDLGKDEAKSNTTLLKINEKI